MNAKRTNLRQMNVPGNDDLSSNRESLNARLKQWRQRLGYCSLLAALPAMLVSDTQKTRAEAATEPEVSVPGRGARLLERLNRSSTNPALLKRQSRFRLPHQMGSLNMLAALGGTDDCPGATVPGGSYTAAAPLVVAGDTTGANDTVTALPSYYYSNYGAQGPDHVYSFTLTSRGANPQIEVSTSSGTYRPLIYVLQGGSAGVCPAGTGNFAPNEVVMFDSRWTNGSTATLDDWQVNYLPLNVPLYLFVDSAINDASGSGSYTIRMQDVTIAPSPISNQIDDAQVFVRQQYLDFLGREPDTIGFQNWVGTLTGCPNSGFGEFDNPDCDRVHVSAGFYLSEEFRGRGYWAYRFYQTSLGRAPLFAEFLPDMLKVGGPQSPQQEVVNKQTFTDEWVNRPEFKAKYDALTNPMDYVNELLSTTGVTLANRDALVNSLQNKQMTRAQVLREIVESKDVEDKFFIPAFVSMQYFGYLRRDPDTIGYNNWVTTLTNDPGNYRHMIFGFIYSPEYRNRFGQP